VFEIQGVIQEPIQQEDIVLKRNNVQVPWEYDVQRINNKWFVWGVAPQNAHNYTLYIEDVHTLVQGIQTIVTLNQTFTVTEISAPYTVRPGFFSTLDAEFEAEIFSYLDTDETITLAGVAQTEFVLEPGANELSLTLPLESSTGFYTITAGIYEIPLYLARDLSTQPSEENETEDEYFIVAPGFVESVLLLDAIQPYPLSIYNPANVAMQDIAFTYNSDVFVISPALINEIAPGETIEVILTPKTTNIPIDEVIIIRNAQYTTEIPILITYASNENETGTGYLDNTQLAFCQVQGGQPCFGEEVCSGDVVASRDYTQCCLGTCAFPETESASWGAVIGWLLGAIVLIIVVIIGGRYMKTRKPKVKPISKQIPAFGKTP